MSLSRLHDNRKREVSEREKEPKPYRQMIECYLNEKDCLGGIFDED